LLCDAKHYSGNLLPLIQLHHGLQGYSIRVCIVTSNAKREEKKEILSTSKNESKVKGKFYSLYEDLKPRPQIFFFRYFRMSSATFDKRLVLLGPGLTFQDNRMRNSLPPDERLAVTLKLKKTFCLIFYTYFIHCSFIWRR
jgi:hypothetical protein